MTLFGRGDSGRGAGREGGADGNLGGSVEDQLRMTIERYRHAMAGIDEIYRRTFGVKTPEDLPAFVEHLGEIFACAVIGREQQATTNKIAACEKAYLAKFKDAARSLQPGDAQPNAAAMNGARTTLEELIGAVQNQAPQFLPRAREEVIVARVRSVVRGDLDLLEKTVASYNPAEGQVVLARLALAAGYLMSAEKAGFDTTPVRSGIDAKAKEYAMTATEHDRTVLDMALDMPEERRGKYMRQVEDATRRIEMVLATVEDMVPGVQLAEFRGDLSRNTALYAPAQTPTTGVPKTSCSVPPLPPRHASS